MKNALRLYMTFIPTRILPWVIFVIYPVVVTLLSITGGGYLWKEIYIATIVYIVEVIMSGAMFREFESKEPVRFDYIHSSERGMKVFGSVMKADVIRRFITSLIIFMLPVVWYDVLHMGYTSEFISEVNEGIPAISPMSNMMLLFVALTAMEVIVYLFKRLRSAALISLFSFIAYIFLMYVNIMLLILPEILPAMLMIVADVITAAIYVLVVVFLYRDVMKCEKRKLYE